MTSLVGTFTNNVSVGSPVTDPLKANNKAGAKITVNAANLQLVSSHAGNSLTFHWPTGAILESTTNLIPPAVWATVTNPPPTSVNGTNSVTVPISAGRQFFRLRVPGP
jgi:hypothetical protein